MVQGYVLKISLFDIQPSVAVILNEFYENTERDNEVKIEIKKSL